MTKNSYALKGKTNHELILPYAAPYMLYIAISSLPDNTVSQSGIYALRLISVPLLLAFFWKQYISLHTPQKLSGSAAMGAGAGILGTILWILLVAPFADKAAPPAGQTEFILKLITVSTVVPVFEELLMRGFIFRLVYQWWEERRSGTANPMGHVLDRKSINQVPPGALNLPAVLVSTLVFAAGHNLYQYPAAMAYGLLMVALWRIRKDLISCIIAHGVTNLTLLIYINHTGQWGLW